MTAGEIRSNKMYCKLGGKKECMIFQATVLAE
jgi:hypothetical protein